MEIPKTILNIAKVIFRDKTNFYKLQSNTILLIDCSRPTFGYISILSVLYAIKIVHFARTYVRYSNISFNYYSCYYLSRQFWSVLIKGPFLFLAIRPILMWLVWPVTQVHRISQKLFFAKTVRYTNKKLNQNLGTDGLVIELWSESVLSKKNFATTVCYTNKKLNQNLGTDGLGIELWTESVFLFFRISPFGISHFLWFCWGRIVMMKNLFGTYKKSFYVKLFRQV